MYEKVTPDSRYNHIVEYVRDTAWAVLPNVLALIQGIVDQRNRGGRLTSEEIDARLGHVGEKPTDERFADGVVVHAAIDAIGVPGGSRQGAVAVIPLAGVIIHRSDMFEDVSGLASIQRFKSRLDDAIRNEAVSAIVLDIDSPGGAVDGVVEIADHIREARGQKKIISVANSLMASAAYWIGSAASEVVASPSAQVGAIGVFAAHTDVSAQLGMLGVDVTLVSAGEYKIEGNPFAPLSADAEATIQKMVDQIYDQFLGAVAKGRGVTATAVRRDFGRGRLLDADSAMAAGLVDRVETIEAVVDRLLSRGKAGSARAVEITPGAPSQAAQTRENEIDAPAIAAAGPSVQIRRRRLDLLQRAV